MRNSGEHSFGVGIIGLGMASLPHAKSLVALSDRLRVVGVYSPTDERRSAFCEQFGFPPKSSAQDIIDSPEIDAVLLLTPPNARSALVKKLAEAGKHILMEKPLERTTLAATEIVATCDAAQVQLGVVFQHRFRDASIRLREQIAEGALGRIHAVEVSIPWWRDQSYYDEAGRGTLERDGGGVLISQAIHTLDLLMSLVGNVRSVIALKATTGFHSMECEDFVAAGLEFSNGAVGSLLASTASYPGLTESIALHGELGSARLTGGELQIDFADGRQIIVGESAGSGGGANPMDFPFDWHQRLIENFVNSVEQKIEPVPSGRQALEVHRLIDALILSGVKGKRVTL